MLTAGSFLQCKFVVLASLDVCNGAWRCTSTLTFMLSNKEGQDIEEVNHVYQEFQMCHQCTEQTADHTIET